MKIDRIGAVRGDLRETVKNAMGMTIGQFQARLDSSSIDDLGKIYDLAGSTLGHKAKYKTIAGTLFKPELAEVDKALKQATLAEEMYSNITAAYMLDPGAGFANAAGTVSWEKLAAMVDGIKAKKLVEEGIP